MARVRPVMNGGRSWQAHGARAGLPRGATHGATRAALPHRLPRLPSSNAGPCIRAAGYRQSSTPRLAGKSAKQNSRRSRSFMRKHAKSSLSPSKWGLLRLPLSEAVELFEYFHHPQASTLRCWLDQSKPSVCLLQRLKRPSPKKNARNASAKKTRS